MPLPYERVIERLPKAPAGESPHWCTYCHSDTRGEVDVIERIDRNGVKGKKKRCLRCGAKRSPSGFGRKVVPPQKGVT